MIYHRTTNFLCSSLSFCLSVHQSICISLSHLLITLIFTCILCVQMWKYSFAQVIFDTDPATLGKSENEQLKEMSGSVIR